MERSPARASTVPSPLGIDRLLADPARWIGRRRIALLANQASLTSDGTPVLEAAELAWAEGHARFLDAVEGARLYPGPLLSRAGG